MFFVVARSFVCVPAGGCGGNRAAGAGGAYDAFGFGFVARFAITDPAGLNKQSSP